MKKYLIYLVKISITLLAVWYLVSSSKISEETFRNILSPQFFYLFLYSSLAFFISQAIISARILTLLHLAGINISFRDCMRLTFIGNFFNMVVPGSVGGDVVKGYYLAKKETDKKGIASGVVIVDRVIGLLSLLSIGGLSALYIINKTGAKIYIHDYNIRSVTALIGVILLVFFISLVLAKDRRVRDRVKHWTVNLSKGGFIYQVIESLGYVTKKKRYLLTALIVGIIAQIFSLAGLLVFADLFSQKVSSIVSMMAVSSLVLLVGIVPITPGNVGWIELVASLGWSAIGSDRGAEVFLYWRIVTVCCSLPGGIMYFLYRDK